MLTVSPAPKVWQLTRFSRFSCHLMEDGGDLTLIDTGLPGSAAGIVEQAEKIGRPIKRILITHGHNDHCGSLDRVRQRYPAAEVIASARTARLMAGDRTLIPEDEGRPLRGGFATSKTIPTHLVNDGECVGGFRAIFTPGHAPGHVSYFHENTGYLFTGDALHTAGGRLAVSGEFRLGFPFPYFATWDRHLALASAGRIRDLRPTALFPAHGPALIDPAHAIEEAIRHASEAFADHRPQGRARKAA
jgi:glyoxylase-like metal-dependent hydrolase (beta-lactamase superfamily II)